MNIPERVSLKRAQLRKGEACKLTQSVEKMSFKADCAPL